MKKLERKRVWEQAQKRFYGTAEWFLIVAVFTIGIGVLLAVASVSGLVLESKRLTENEIMGLLLPCFSQLRGEKLWARFREFRIWQFVLLMAYTLFVSMVLTNGFFGVTSSIPVHDTAKITETSWSHSSKGGNQYCAWVVLEDGTEERLLVSKVVYDRINRQEDIVLCKSCGLFGTVFAAIHVPGQCPLEGKVYADYYITGKANESG